MRYWFEGVRSCSSARRFSLFFSRVVNNKINVLKGPPYVVSIVEKVIFIGIAHIGDISR